MEQLVAGQVYSFNIEALRLQDVIFDLREKIASAVLKGIQSGLRLNGKEEQLITDIRGQLEFFVRKIPRDKG